MAKSRSHLWLCELRFDAKFAKLYDNWRKLIMDQRTDMADNCFRVFHALMLLILFAMLTGIACKQAVNSPAYNEKAPVNVAAAAKPT
jgi:hypothetical protein